MPSIAGYYCFYSFLNGIIILMISIMMYMPIGGDLDNYQGLVDNWKKDPINDLKITSENCPTGYENFLYYYWPGTLKGCRCNSGARVVGHCKHDYNHNHNCHSCHGVDIPALSP